MTRPNQAWVTDIAYIRTWQGWLYLAVVLNLFSRKLEPSMSRKGNCRNRELAIGVTS